MYDFSVFESVALCWLELVYNINSCNIVIIGTSIFRQHMASVITFERESHLRAYGTNGVDVKLKKKKQSGGNSGKIQSQ